MHRARVPAVDVSLVGTKRRDLKLEIVLEYNDHPEVRADCVRSGEKRLHVFRAGVGGDVVILWYQTAHQVAHAATCEVRNVSAITQALHDLARGFFHWRSLHTLTVAAWLSKAQSRQPACYPALFCRRKE